MALRKLPLRKNFKTKITFLFLTCVFILPPLSVALTDYTVPTMPKAELSNTVIKSVKDDTRVIGAGFELVIPKGWTLNPVGESDMGFTNFNAYPTELIETDPVFFVIQKKKKDMDLKLFEKIQKSNGRTYKLVAGPSFESVRTEYETDEKKYLFVWQVRTKAGNFLVMGGAPKGDKSVETLRSILKTIKFN